MKRSSKNRLNRRHLELCPGETLFDRIARTACRAECLPRKDLFDAWEVARRVRRRFRGGRVVDLACGHGLLAMIMLLLDDSSTEALAVDLRIPPSAAKLAAVFEAEWPRLRGRVNRHRGDIAGVDLKSSDLVVSAHACGSLSDLILQRATTAGARLALLPCCQHLAEADTAGLEGWLDGPLAVDVARVLRLNQLGYRAHTQNIPADITPKNRLLMAAPN